GREIKADARREIVLVPAPLAVHERQNQRVQLVDTTDVLHVRVELVTQTKIQSELRMHAPVVLHETSEISIVRVRQQQRTIGNSAAQRHRKQQIVVVHAAVVIAIEIREVFDQLDA